ncbi:MAG: glutathione S-transferase family protein [Alphaproteobacteria bacterium]|jgi:glutathione S-transferase|nr:glutathione S-transferase family protein [Alphaproteobacteria bacterium]OIN87192.1 MAG: glutathione S-transferase [Alphaproteobacteria bacterium CG1_02_46_17]
MRTLFHLWLQPFSRKVRIIMSEKGLDFDLKLEKIWERRTDFLALNPAGDVPVLVEEDGTTLSGSWVIGEYLEEVYPEIDLIGRDAYQRAETRRLVSWFDIKFSREVTDNLVGEKMMKRFLRLGEPNGPAIRAGHANIHYHLDYISFLCEKRNWLAGDHFSQADIAAAAHLSTVDYIGDVPWDQHSGAREWYARVKSRRSFQGILEERLPGHLPAQHYGNVDF